MSTGATVYEVCDTCGVGKVAFDKECFDGTMHATSAGDLKFREEHAEHRLNLVPEQVFLSAYLQRGYHDVDRPNAKPIVTSIGGGAAPGGEKPMPYGAPESAKDAARKARDARRALQVSAPVHEVRERGGEHVADISGTPTVVPTVIAHALDSQNRIRIVDKQAGIDATYEVIDGDETSMRLRKIALRPSWDETFLRVAEVLAQRGTCSRLKVGAVLAKDTRIISTGYNGAPAGLRHCDHRDGGDMENGHCSRAEHAERNALLLSRADARGATMYVTASPCLACARMAVTVGVTRIVYGADYQPDQRVDELCAAAGIELVALR